MRHTRSILIALLAVVLLGVGTASATGSGTSAPDARQDVFGDLVGTWDVRQRSWAGPGAAPIKLPPATATVHLAPGGGYLEEEMTQAGAADPFTRHVLLGYNSVTRNYEYVSFDSRAPQMMAYPTSRPGAGGIWFTLSSPFVLPEWGEYRDAAFTGRLQLQPGKDRFTVRLYWTHLSGQPSEEFVAMEYVYTRSWSS